MSDAAFTRDVFLSHISEDKAAVRKHLEILRAGVLHVGECVRLRLGAVAPDGLSTLNHQPTSGPLNKERRFIPLRLDDAPIKDSLVRFLYIRWRRHRQSLGRMI